MRTLSARSSDCFMQECQYSAFAIGSCPVSRKRQSQSFVYCKALSIDSLLIYEVAHTEQEPCFQAANSGQ